MRVRVCVEAVRWREVRAKTVGKRVRVSELLFFFVFFFWFFGFFFWLFWQDRWRGVASLFVFDTDVVATKMRKKTTTR